MREAEHSKTGAICAVLLTVASVLSSPAAHAVGLGDLTLRSALGQPLHASVALHGVDTGDAPASCYKARLESADGAFLHAARVALTPSSRPTALLVSSVQNVNEPAVRLRVEFSCGARLQRDYQMLLDPPELMPQLAVAAPSAPAAAVTPPPPQRRSARRDSVPVESNANGGEAATPAARPPRQKPQTRPSPAPEKATVAPAPPQPVAAAPRNVLRLSSDDVHESAPAADAGAAATAAADTRLAALQTRVLALEAEAARLKLLSSQYDMALNAATAANLAAAAKKESESTYWLFGLGLLLLFCLAAIGWLAWRMQQLRTQSAAGWSAGVRDQAIEDDVVGADTHFADFVAVSAAPEPQPELTAAAAAAEAAIRAVYSGQAAPEPETAPEPRTAGPDGESRTRDNAFENGLSPLPFHADSGALHVQELHADTPNPEEILDKMQEAEFWISLQNSEMAIEVLESYETGAEPNSPVPWLYLLDLYRSVGEQHKYDLLRERFRLVFNGNVPEWGIQFASEARSLDDYPHLMERIASLWHTDAILPYLESLLTDDREGGRGGFDLPGYRDILFLVGLATELRGTAVPAF